MACFMILLLVAVVVCGFWREAVAQNNAVVQGVDNAEQFALLCRIYNVAENPPINHVYLQDPLKIVNEIDAINSSFAEERQFNETEQAGYSGDARLKPITTREAAVAQAILVRITQKAHKILEEIIEVNVSKEIEKAKSEFHKVIFGEAGNEIDLDQGALKGVGERGTACGAAGLLAKGQSAGNNLVVDFFCLCAQRKEDGIHDACGVKVGGKDEKSGKHSWGDAAPSGSSSMWASVKKGCGNLLYQHPKSIEEGHEVIGDFLKHLISGGVYRWDSAKNSDGKKGMLGTSACKNGGPGKGPICDGKKGNNGAPGGICVYYGQDNWKDRINWLKQFQTALASVNFINNHTASIQRDIEKLQMLQHRAEEIYETATVITEIQNPKGNTTFQNESGNLTAHNATRTRSYSYSYHTYFIPMLVLFFL